MTETTPTPAAVSTEKVIVVGVDGSACATRALDYAAGEAERTDSILRVVTVYAVIPASGLVVTPCVCDQVGAEEIVQHALERVSESHPGVITKGAAVFGAAGPVLVDQSMDASLLVVGTRGHSALVGMMLGSVSEYVVHHARCTTTVVR
jgi:nucleotide-binding universal stress UspA family protein